MDLSPNDIRNYEFPNQMRGYSKEEVDSFMEGIATTIETLKQENLKLSMELDSVKGQLTSLRNFEDTIKKAAIDARRNADKTQEDAKLEAEQMLSEAKTAADQMISDRVEQAANLEKSVMLLEDTRVAYLGKLETLIKSHLDLLEAISDGPLVDIPKVDIPKIEKHTKPVVAPVALMNAEVPEQSSTEQASTEQSSTEQSPAERPPAERPPAEQLPVEHAPVKYENGDKIEVTDSSEVDGNVRETIANNPVGVQPDEDMVGQAEVNQPSDEKTPKPTGDQPSDNSPAGLVDPELAAALQSYQDAPKQNIPAPPANQPEQSDKPEGWIETTRRAEDIPEGFFVKPDEKPPANDEAPPTSDTNPNISAELENVAAKFAKEMEKADTK